MGNRSSSCSYSCAASDRPGAVAPNSDISGIGVVVGYVTTAFMVVCLVTAFYISSFDLTKDPFEADAPNGVSVADNSQRPRRIQHRPNPIDVVFLDVCHRYRELYPRPVRSFFKAETGFLGLYNPAQVQQPRRPDPGMVSLYTDCIKSMNDVQIFTGLSILISGYANLKCGLSCYHWKVMVYLAWFSTLTHLSCLTFLRARLYVKKRERTWRVILMALVLVMLLFAIIPTGRYDWSGSTLSQPQPKDYAICYLDFRPWDSTPDSDGFVYATMILSVLVLALGFVTRVVKVYKVLSVTVVKGTRSRISRFLRCGLLWLYRGLKLDVSRRRWSLRRTLIYRPLLALFLVIRVSVDMWASMIVEVWWLISTLAWGLISLLRTRAVSNGGENDWSFGQIVPVVLLIAPLATVFEYFHDKSTQRQSPSVGGATSQTGSVTVVGPPSSIQGMTLDSGDNMASGYPHDHPDLDFYAHAKWINELIFFVLLCIVATTITLMTFYAALEVSLVFALDPFPEDRLSFWQWLPIVDTIILSLFVLYCLLVADHDSRELGVSSRGSIGGKGWLSSEIRRAYVRFFIPVARVGFPYVLFVTVLAFLHVPVPYLDPLKQPLILYSLGWYVLMCCMGRVAEIS